MGGASYLAVLGFCFLGTAWLEVFLRTRVYRRWLRLLLTIVPVAAIFCAWDAYAIANGHWSFDAGRLTGVVLPLSIPLEELLFFVVIPACAVLTLEAVRSVRGWEVGDEDPAAAGEATR